MSVKKVTITRSQLISAVNNCAERDTTRRNAKKLAQTLTNAAKEYLCRVLNSSLASEKLQLVFSNEVDPTGKRVPCVTIVFAKLPRKNVGLRLKMTLDRSQRDPDSVRNHYLWVYMDNITVLKLMNQIGDAPDRNMVYFDNVRDTIHGLLRDYGEDSFRVSVAIMNNFMINNSIMQFESNIKWSYQTWIPVRTLFQTESAKALWETFILPGLNEEEQNITKQQ